MKGNALLCGEFSVIRSINFVVAATLLIAGASASAATQSWNGYHWARTGPPTITLGDNVAPARDSYLRVAANDWSAAANIDFKVATGTSSPSACGASYGNVQVCNANYGATGWLGIASVWVSSGVHIV